MEIMTAATCKIASSENENAQVSSEHAIEEVQFFYFYADFEFIYSDLNKSPYKKL